MTSYNVVQYMNEPPRKVERRTGKKSNLSRGAFADRLWEESFIYIKTVVDTVRQPFLLLDKDLRVIAANESYYVSFKESSKKVEKVYLHELSGGAWNIPELIAILKDIAENKCFLRGFEISKEFPNIGKKVLLLSARHIYRDIDDTKVASNIIFLAIEDATELMRVAELIIKNSGSRNLVVPEKMIDLEKMISELEADIYKVGTKKVNKKSKSN